MMKHVYAIVLFLLPVNVFAGYAGVSGGGSGKLIISGDKTGKMQVYAPTPTPAPSISVVQSSCTASPGSDPMSISFNSAVTVGNSIIIGAADTGESYGAGTITDNKGNSYTDYPAGGVGNGSARVTIFASLAVATGGSSFTVTADPSGTGVTQNMCMVEVSGITTADDDSTNSGSGTTATTGNITTSGSIDFCYAIISHSSPGTTLTQAGTLIGEDENNTTDQTYNAQYTLPSAGTQNLSVTIGASSNWVMNGACFK